MNNDEYLTPLLTCIDRPQTLKVYILNLFPGKQIKRTYNYLLAHSAIIIVISGFG